MNATHYLQSITWQLQYLQSPGEKALLQIPEEKLSWQYNKESNSVVMSAKHLKGGMISGGPRFLQQTGKAKQNP